jgi:hypothetical protein
VSYRCVDCRQGLDIAIHLTLLVRSHPSVPVLAKSLGFDRSESSRPKGDASQAGDQQYRELRSGEHRAGRRTTGRGRGTPESTTAAPNDEQRAACDDQRASTEGGDIRLKHFLLLLIIVITILIYIYYKYFKFISTSKTTI